MVGVTWLTLAVWPTADPVPGKDLALVPGNAVGFVHMRLADIYQSPAMAELRGWIAKAGPTGLSNLEKRFPVPLSSLDRLTIIFVSAPDNNVLTLPNPLFVITSKSPMDRVKMTAFFVSGGVELQVGGRPVTTRFDTGASIHFVDDRTAVIGYATSMSPWFQSLGNGDSFMKVEAAAAASRLFTAVFDGSRIPVQLLTEIPPKYQQALKPQRVAVSIDFGQEMVMNLSARYADGMEAVAAENAVRDGIRAARTFIGLGQVQLNLQLNAAPNKEISGFEDMGNRLSLLYGSGQLQVMSDWLGQLEIRREGSELRSSQPIRSSVLIPWLWFLFGMTAYFGNAATAGFEDTSVPAIPAQPEPPSR